LDFGGHFELLSMREPFWIFKTTGCPKSHAPTLNIHISHSINCVVTNLAWIERGIS
jgi:hypothetical protein